MNDRDSIKALIDIDNGDARIYPKEAVKDVVPFEA